MRLSFLTYNIQDGGRARERDLIEILSAASADVIVLQEVIETEFVARLGERVGAEWFVAESNSERRLALVSRYPLSEAESFHPPVLRHALLAARIEYAPGNHLDVFGVHLAAPAYTLWVEMRRLREVTAVLGQIKRRAGEAVVIGGDFNSIAPGDRVDFTGVPDRVRWAVYLQGGLVARQVIGRMQKAGFVDCYRALDSNEPGFTLPSDPPQVRLDYFFVNARLRPALRACQVVQTPAAVRSVSDHLPVRLELEL